MSPNLEIRAIQKSCQDVINCVSESSLNFSVKITPFSIYITLRKSFSNCPVNTSSLRAATECHDRDELSHGQHGEHQELVKSLQLKHS